MFNRLASVRPQLVSRQVRGMSSFLQNYETKYAESIADPERFWGDVAREKITWDKDFNKVSNHDLEQGHISWFEGGSLNACENCVDRHVENGKGDQVALLWEGDEVGSGESITYKQLKAEVSRLANVLKGEKIYILLFYLLSI